MKTKGEQSVATMTTAEELLLSLAQALDNAFISTWQTTSAWQKELDDALKYLKNRKLHHENT